jgi:hypothetical protein
MSESKKRARSGDPHTSHEAAEGIGASAGELQRWAAACVKLSPGKTQRELGRSYCPTDPRKIGRRLVECERLGLVRRGEARVCAVSGRRAQTWWPPATSA